MLLHFCSSSSFGKLLFPVCMPWRKFSVLVPKGVCSEYPHLSSQCAWLRKRQRLNQHIQNILWNSRICSRKEKLFFIGVAKLVICTKRAAGSYLKTETVNKAIGTLPQAQDWSQDPFTGFPFFSPSSWTHMAWILLFYLKFWPFVHYDFFCIHFFKYTIKILLFIAPKMSGSLSWPWSTLFIFNLSSIWILFCSENVSHISWWETEPNFICKQKMPATSRVDTVGWFTPHPFWWAYIFSSFILEPEKLKNSSPIFSCDYWADA